MVNELCVIRQGVAGPNTINRHMFINTDKNQFNNVIFMICLEHEVIRTEKIRLGCKSEERSSESEPGR